jgi:hypothetical protein
VRKGSEGRKLLGISRNGRQYRRSARFSDITSFQTRLDHGQRRIQLPVTRVLPSFATNVRTPTSKSHESRTLKPTHIAHFALRLDSFECGLDAQHRRNSDFRLGDDLSGGDKLEPVDCVS